jgi:hypothetical protein
MPIHNPLNALPLVFVSQLVACVPSTDDIIINDAVATKTAKKKRGKTARDARFLLPTPGPPMTALPHTAFA